MRDSSAQTREAFRRSTEAQRRARVCLIGGLTTGLVCVALVLGAIFGWSYASTIDFYVALGTLLFTTVWAFWYASRCLASRMPPPGEPMSPAVGWLAELFLNLLRW